MIWYSLSVSVSAGATVTEVAGVDAHRIDVLDRADDDAVVVAVAHDLHLVLFPAEHRFLDQHLGGRRGVEAALHDVEELVAIVGDAAAGAAQGERRPDDRRQADHVERRRPPPRDCARPRSWAIRRPILVMASRNSSRSSALSIASALAPISSTPSFSSRPSRCSAIAVLSAVWPPMVGRMASGLSFSMILATMSGVIGSM